MWNQYPEKYSFIKYDFHLSMDGQQISRQTYGILDLFGDVGGLFELFKIFFGFIALPFSQIRMAAFLTNRLFHQSLKSGGALTEITNSEYIESLPNGNVTLSIP